MEMKRTVLTKEFHIGINPVLSNVKLNIYYILIRARTCAYQG